jgi:hypothetical protein
MNDIKLFLAIISLFLIAACGGGGGDALPTTDPATTPTATTPAATTPAATTPAATTPAATTPAAAAPAAAAPATKTVNGVVADGYLSGAIVCLDTNNNKKCDVGERTGTTGAGGAYTIPNVNSADLATYPIVVEVPAGAVDSDRGPVTNGYVMSAPAGKPEFISPLTTLVQSQIESSGQSLTDAVATIKTQLGLVTLSPMDDYKPGVAGASAESVVAAGVATVIATAIADNKKAIETAITGTNVTTQQVVNLIVQQVMQNLASMVTQVNTATNNGAIATALTETQISGVVTSSGATIPTTNITELQQQLSAATPSTATSMKLTVALQGTDVKAVSATITFPAGVSLRVDATGKLQVGVLSGLGGAAVASFLDGKYTAATAASPATLTLGLMSTTTSLVAGDIISINANLATGTAAPAASAFILSATKFTGSSVGGNTPVIIGASLSLR